MIGTRLRELRTARGLSLRSLAEETGLSATLLSQIERGVTEPSLKSLRLVADVFGQSVAMLFDEGAVQAVHISHAGERSKISSPRGHIQYERLMPGNAQLAVLRGVLEPGESSSDEPWSHVAIECAYVLTGVLTVMVGDSAHEVVAGDAITIDSSQPHRYRNTTNHTVEFILSVNPPTP
ncbi:XRE family transcriptional regulator [Leifsonia sp. Root4]|uniref:helix-turn-helix domain-containing protein n=1 Tax=Leifsonia sp. Root4 TaxID=1736525 RepID=UPI0006FD1947|nr:XRE family transcriptional regulator [Leifsonia sp. Root4]KQW06211.1 XRE family transcriptional regulator [Leifsonia sp. Root4]